MYGWMTKSFLSSTEHRQMKDECRKVTQAYESGPKPGTEILLCHCRSFRFSHELSAHRKLRSDYDWRPWQQRQSMEMFE